MLTHIISDTGKPCTDPNPSEGQHVQSPADTYSCVNNQAYYLVTASGSETDSGGGFSNGPITFNNFEAPPGLDTLDGTRWGGLTREDLTAGYAIPSL